MFELFISILPFIIIAAIVSLVRRLARGGSQPRDRSGLFSEMERAVMGNPPAQQPMPPISQLHNSAQQQQLRQNPQAQQTLHRYDQQSGAIVRCVEYTTAFKEAYYKANDRGRNFDPWELPPEKAPWE